MGQLTYLMNVSLDGFVEDSHRSLDWTGVTDELHRWFTDRTQAAGALVYGRRLYETMAPFWSTAESDPNATDVIVGYARAWNSRPKIVFSSTLTEVGANCRLVRGDPVEELARIRDDYEGELEIGGPTLAATFVQRGLIDRYDVVVHPVAIGAGTPYIPQLDAPLRLRLVETDTFANGTVHLGYEAVRD